jgi:hypothetical protein
MSVKAGSKMDCHLLSSSAYSLTLKMQEICSSEMSVDFQRTTRRCIPKFVLLMFDQDKDRNI